MRSMTTVRVVNAVRHAGVRTAARVSVVLVAGTLTASASLTAVYASSHVSAAPRQCSGGRQASLTACAVMPASGTFTLPIPGTPAVLFGAGTPDRAGKTIIIKRAPLVCKSLGGFGIRLVTPRSTGLLPPLHWKNGTLYYRDHTSGRCVGVASPALAAAPGMYQVVPGTGVTSMPKTGGGDPVRQPFAPAAPAIFSLLVLLAGGVRLARAR